MEDIWFEDDLVPLKDQVTDSTRGDKNGEYDSSEVKAVVRIARPVWKNIKSVDFPAKGKLWLLRMRVEFETLNPRAEFLYAHCEAFIENLYPDDKDDPYITEIFPEKLIDQEPKNIKVKLEPSIKFGFAEVSAEASVGEISKEIVFGRISSETNGYIGEKERNPHWNLNPGKYQIDGIRDFFMVIDQPPGSRMATIRIRVDARVKNHKGIFHLGPKEEQKIWANRPRILIE